MFDSFRLPILSFRQSPAPLIDQRIESAVFPAPFAGIAPVWPRAARPHSADSFIGAIRPHAVDTTSNCDAPRIPKSPLCSTPSTVDSLDQVLNPFVAPLESNAPTLDDFQRAVWGAVGRRCSEKRARAVGRSREFLATSLLQPNHGPRRTSIDQPIQEQRLQFWCALDMLPGLFQDLAGLAVRMREDYRSLFGEAVLRTVRLPRVQEWHHLFLLRPRDTKATEGDIENSIYAYSEAVSFRDRPPSADLLACMLRVCRPWFHATQFVDIKQWVDTWKPHVAMTDKSALLALKFAETEVRPGFAHSVSPPASLTRPSPILRKRANASAEKRFD